MKNKILLSLLLVFGSVSLAQAGLFSGLKDDIKDKGKDELKGKLTHELDSYCFKIPATNYYICPPISPDMLDKY